MARAKGRKPLNDLQVAAREAADQRSGLNRPMKLGDLAPHEQEQVVHAVSQTTRNLSNVLMQKAESVRGTVAKKRAARAEVEDVSDVKESDPGARFEAASKHPGLLQGPVDMGQMTKNLVNATVDAAAGNVRLPHEPIAGTGFYFGHQSKLTDPLHFRPNAEQILNISQASARLSPRTSPSREARTASALMDAHHAGEVRFTPEVVHAASKSYKDAAGNRQQGIHIDEGLHGQAVPFKMLPGEVVNHLRKGHMEGVLKNNSTGVNWGELRATPLGANVMNAHSVLQGTGSISPFENPKQWGYSRSIAHSTPEHAALYHAVADHVGKVLRGEADPHNPFGNQLANLPESHILSPHHAIAADMWHRATTFGQPLDIAASTAQIFHPTKSYQGINPITGEHSNQVMVARGDTRVTPVGMEHAIQQHVTEQAAMEIGRRVGLPHGIPSVMLQETAWARTRRAAGGDPQFNEYRRLNPNQFR